MTSIRSQPDAQIRMTDRLSIKLAVLFLITLAVLALAFLIYDLFVWNVEKSLLETGLPTQPAVVDIDPKIESELAEVLKLEEAPKDLVVKDPFTDRTGISEIERSVTTATSRRRASVSGESTANSTSPNQNPATKASTAKKRTPGGSADKKKSPPVLDTGDRLQIWEGKSKFGFLGDPDSAIFAIDDLIPVGVVDGGNGEEEVMFFSKAANRTLSFRVGTRFYDGRLLEIRSDGVLFGSEINQKLLTRLKSWGRSIRTSSSQSVSVVESEGEPSTGKSGNRGVVTGGSN